MTVNLSERMTPPVKLRHQSWDVWPSWSMELDISGIGQLLAPATRRREEHSTGERHENAGQSRLQSHQVARPDGDHRRGRSGQRAIVRLVLAVRDAQSRRAGARDDLEPWAT